VNVTMLTVHHLNNSRSQRVLWMLEELAVPYEVVRYERDAVTSRAPESLRKVHPLGRSPVVTEDGLTIAESGAILEYLVERHGAGRMIPPPGTPERLRYRYWLHFAEGSAMPPLLLKLIFDRVASAPMPFFVKPIARGIAAKVGEGFIDPTLRDQLDYIEVELARSAWFAGDEITAADVQMSFPLQVAMARASAGTPRPRIAAFLARIEARLAYQRALTRGGPFGIIA
jgi:glutathione S-transferase